MRERIAVEMLEILNREAPHIMRAYAGGGIEDALRRAKIAAGVPVPVPVCSVFEQGGASSRDPRVELDDGPRRPRQRRSSAPVLAAQAKGVQHFVRAREELDAGIEEIGEAAKAAVAIDEG